MNWLDYVFLAILLLSVWLSAMKGFSREIIGLAAMFLALMLGMWFYGLAGSYLLPYVSSARTANMIGFLLVVVAVIICGRLLGLIVNRFIKTIGLSFFDHLVGGAFGVVRGLLICITLLTTWMTFGPTPDPKTASSAMVNSRIAPYVLDASHFFVTMAPMEFKSGFQKQYTQIKSLLATNAQAHND